MELKKGITFHSTSSDILDAISINSGIIHHSEKVTEKVKYGTLSFTPLFEDNAFIPKRDWRKLNIKEMINLQSKGKRNDYKTIYIGDIPENLRILFQKMNLGDCKSREDVIIKFKENIENTIRVSNATNDFLTAISEGNSFKFHYLGANLPNLEVVACDTTVMPLNYREEDKMYMGIHNDGTKFVSTHQLSKLGNRLTINLGKEERSFFFINLTLTQVLNMLKKKISIIDNEINIVNISKYFFKYFPDYPVIKIRQKPYQFYIAPTDNCFHDGSTYGSNELDIIIVYFGAFQY